MFRSPPKWLLGNRRTRSGLAIVLLALTAAVLGSKLLEDVFIERLRRDCGSLFADRLLPSTMLFHLNDEMHMKQRGLEHHLSGVDARASEEVRRELTQRDAALDRLIDEFEQTYLVKDEAQHLRALRVALENYQSVEHSLLTEPAPPGTEWRAKLQQAFENVHLQLLRLSDVQHQVGKELERDSEASASGVTLLLYFQLGVAFVLGLIAAALAMSLGTRSPPARRPDSKLH